MNLGRERFRELCLGAADLSVEDPASPARGLHEFSLGFDAQTRRVAAALKMLRPVVVRVDRALKQVRGLMNSMRRRALPAREEVGQ